MLDVAQRLSAAREAARGGAWEEARRRFEGVDAAALGADDLSAMADALWWTSRLEESIAVRRRAHAAHAAAGDRVRAAREAWFLWADLHFVGSHAVAAGWLRRAERHLEGLDEGRQGGLVVLARAEDALGDGDPGRAAALAGRALDLGGRLSDPDLSAMALQVLGRARLAEGRAEEGVGLLDEAMCAVVADELEPLFAGWIFCVVLTVCVERADLRRAGEWSVAALRWCEAIGGETPFRGLCRIYRVEVATLLGRWAEAEREAERAAAVLEQAWPRLAGAARYALGAIHLRRGRLERAEQAFLAAGALGRDEQPGLALVRLAQGRPDEAAAGLRRAAAAGGPVLQRAGVLSALVEVALAGDDVLAARESARALAELAGGRAALQAAADAAAAAVDLAEGLVEPALRAAGRAWAAWQELGMPYEAARARLLLGRACLAAGDAEGARRELEAARAAFARLGAARDAGLALAPLRRPGRLPGGLSPREAQVLRLVAGGRTNREVAAALHLSEHTVARHLQNAFTKIGVSSRAAAAAFAVEHGLS